MKKFHFLFLNLYLFSSVTVVAVQAEVSEQLIPGIPSDLHLGEKAAGAGRQANVTQVFGQRAELVTVVGDGVINQIDVLFADSGGGCEAKQQMFRAVEDELEKALGAAEDQQGEGECDVRLRWSTPEGELLLRLSEDEAGVYVAMSLS